MDEDGQKKPKEIIPNVFEEYDALTGERIVHDENGKIIKHKEEQESSST